MAEPAVLYGRGQSPVATETSAPTEQQTARASNDPSFRALRSDESSRMRSSGSSMRSYSSSSQRIHLEDMLQDYEPPPASNDKAVAQSEFIMMVHFVGSIVRSIIEGFLDAGLVILLIVPLFCPWRTMAIVRSLERASEGSWRLHLRLWALAQVFLAIVDCLIGPVLLLAFVMPTRPYAIWEVLNRRDEVYKPLKILGREVDAHYNYFMRVFLASQLVFGILDLFCIVLALIALLHPWRAVYLLSGHQRFLSEMRKAENERTTEALDADRSPFDQGRWNLKLNDLRRWWFWGSLGLFFDWIAFPFGLLSLAIPTRTLPFLREFAVLFLKSREDFSSSQNGVVIRVFSWPPIWMLCMQNFVYGVMDMLVLPLFIIIVLTLIRAVPLLEDFRRHWVNLPFLLVVKLDMDLRGGGASLDQIRAQIYKPVAEIHEGDKSGRPETDFATTEVVVVANASLGVHGGRDATSAVGAKWVKPTLNDEFTGKYILSSGFGSEIRYYRVTSDCGFDTYVACKRLTFIFYRHGCWQLCLTEDAGSAGVRWMFDDLFSGRRPQTHQISATQNSKFTSLKRESIVIECMTGEGNDNWSPVDSTAFKVARMEHQLEPEFGAHGYNCYLRLSIMRNFVYLFLDFLLLPFFLIMGIFLYRFPALLRSMREDSEIKLAELLELSEVGKVKFHDARKGGTHATYTTDTVGDVHFGKLGLSFGFKSRRMLLRQNMYILGDVFLVPMLLIILLTVYRVPRLKRRFTVHDASWHFAVVMNANMVLYDGLIALPLLLVYATGYRYKYVEETRSECRNANANLDIEYTIEWKPRIEIIRQASLICCDALVFPFLLLIIMTRYRVRYIDGKFEPRSLRYHAAVVCSALWIFHDAFILLPCALACFIVVHRMQAIANIIRSPPEAGCAIGDDLQINVRKAIYLQVLLAVFDIVSLPPALLCLLTFYRWKHVHKYLPHLTGSVELLHKGAVLVEFHRAAYQNMFIIWHDLVFMLPASLLIILTVYRIGIVRDGLNEYRESLTSDYEAYVNRSAGVATDANEEREGADVFQGADVNTPTEGTTDGNEDREGGDDGDDGDTESAMDDFRDAVPEQPWEPRGGATPEAWFRITQQLAAQDPRWGDLVDWNVPVREEPVFTRRKFWSEVLGVILDLPFILFSFLIVLTLWRLPLLLAKMRLPQTQWNRRKTVLWQIAFTFRDLCLLPFALILLLTPRGCTFVAALCARRRKPLQLEPLLECMWVEVTAPRRQSKSVEPYSVLIGTRRVSQTRPLSVAPESFRVQALGAGFWRSVARVRGRAKAGIARSLFPVRPVRAALTDASGLRLSPVFASASGATATNPGSPDNDDGQPEFVISMSFHGRHGVLRGVDEDEWIKIQVEGLEEIAGDLVPLRRRPCVLSSFALKVATALQLVTPGATVRMPEELLRGGEDPPDFVNASHKGVAESFAGLLATDILELVVDIFHALLAIMLILLPWRFMMLVRSLFEPDELWASRNASYLLECVQDAGNALQKIRAELLPAFNDLAKDAMKVEKWCEYGEVDVRAASVTNDAFLEYKHLLWLIRQTTNKLPETISNKVFGWLETEDASFYYTALGSYTNCLLSTDRLTVEEQGLIIDRVRGAEASFDKVRARSLRDANVAIDHCVNQVRSVGFSLQSFRRKDTQLKRSIVRSVALSAAMDALALIGSILIIFTIYRLPTLFSEVRKERANKLTSNRFKAVVGKQVRACLEEAILLLSILVLWGLVIITLVRLPEAMHEVVFVIHSLTLMRDMLRRQLIEAASSFWELFSLLTLIKTYKMIGKILAHILLVPPVCLGELLNRLIGPAIRTMHLGIRLSICVVSFYSLALFPVLILISHSSREAWSTYLLFLSIVISLLIGNMLALTISKDLVYFREYTIHQQGSILTMRASWANIMKVGNLYLNRSLLALYLLCCHLHQHFALPSACELGEQLAITSMLCTVLWMLLVASIFMVEQQSATDFRKSSLLLNLQVFFSEICFVPILIGLIGRRAIGCDPPTSLLASDCVSIFLLAAYLVTTQMLSGEGTRLRALSGRGLDDCEIDARFPPLFTIGNDLLDMLIVVIPVLMFNGPFQLVLLFIIACLSLGWIPLYRHLFKVTTCIVYHVVPLQLGCSAALAWVVLFIFLTKTVSDAIDAALPVGIIICLGGSLMCAWRTYTRAFDERKMRLIDSAIPEHIGELVASSGDLCVASELGSYMRQEHWDNLFKKAPTSIFLRGCILEFEQHILAERLDANFIANHSEWIHRVAEAATFTRLAPLVRVLCDSIRSPSTLPAITKLAAELLGREDLAPRLVDLLVGHRTLDMLLDTVLLATSSGQLLDMKVHCVHARVAMESTLSLFRAALIAPGGVEQLSVESKAGEMPKSRFELRWQSSATSQHAHRGQMPTFNWSFLSNLGGRVFTPVGRIVDDAADALVKFLQFRTPVPSAGPKPQTFDAWDDTMSVASEEPTRATHRTVGASPWNEAGST